MTRSQRRPKSSIRLLGLLLAAGLLVSAACGTLEVGLESPVAGPKDGGNTATVTLPVIDASPTPAVTPTGGKEDSTPTTTPSGVSEIAEPLLIDGERGWIFASAKVDGSLKTVKLATQDGRLTAAYDLAGRLALDRTANRLLIDRGDAGVASLHASTGALQASVTLPMDGGARADPQVDPSSGLGYVFRGKSVHVVDPTAATIERVVTLSIPTSTCGEPGEDAPIGASFYDLVNHRLYLVFTTYVCTPWVTHTIIAYEADTLAELGRYDTGLRYQAVPFSDSLYGTLTSRLGRSVSWAWNGRDVWFEEGDVERRLQGIVADWGRQLVYEALDGQIWVFTPYPREVLARVDVAILAEGGRLAGHDPISDQLYFLADGRLSIRPTSIVLQE